jgi:hypothetical protein
MELTPAERAAHLRQFEADMAALERSISAETALAQFPAAGTPKKPFDKAHVSILHVEPVLWCRRSTCNHPDPIQQMAKHGQLLARATACKGKGNIW